MTAKTNRAAELAESLRNMRSVARRHHDGAGGKLRWSVVLDTDWAGDLSDAADLIEKLAREVERLNAPAVLLTVEEIRQAVRPMYMYAGEEAAEMGLSDDEATARLIESAVLAVNGKAVS